MIKPQVPWRILKVADLWPDYQSSGTAPSEYTGYGFSQIIVKMKSDIEVDVQKSLLERPAAEKVFQPWWDAASDYLLNVLLALGKCLIFLC